jgi:hypothetical protein
LKSTRAAHQNVGGLAVRMHQSVLVHVSQSREHTSQDVPHPCHFQWPHFQESPGVCVEALKDKAHHSWLFLPLKESDIQKFHDVGVARQSDVAPRFGIGSSRSRRPLNTSCCMKHVYRHQLLCTTARNSWIDFSENA